MYHATGETEDSTLLTFTPWRRRKLRESVPRQTVVYAEAMRCTMTLGNVPIFVLGDLNPTTKGGPELETTRKKRGWRNIMEEWAGKDG